MAASPPNALPWATVATRSRRVLAASRRRSGSAYPLDASSAGTRSAAAPPGATSSSARSTNATEVGQVRKPGPARRPPRGVAGRQRLPHLGGHPLAADPGRVPGNEVEPAARQDVGEVRFEREERGTALKGETARGHPELTATGAQPREQRALVQPEP